MSIDTPIPEIQLFQNLTLKIQGQGHSSSSHSGANSLWTHFLSFQVNQPSHSWYMFTDFYIVQGQGHSSRSHSGSEIFSTKIPFFPCQRPSHSWYRAFKYLTLTIKGQGHGWGQISLLQSGSSCHSTHNLLVPYQSAIPFLEYSFFKIWPWSHSLRSHSGSNIVSTHIPFISCQSTLLFLAETKFDLENSRSRPCWGERSMSHNYPSIHLMYFLFLFLFLTFVFIWCISFLFHVNWPNCSYMTNSMFFRKKKI